MRNFFFTFGSDPQFPYGRDEYVLVRAENLSMAVAAFRMVHPDRVHTNFVNCANFYDEESFAWIRETYYGNRGPVETISISLTVNKGGCGNEKAV